eukprot:TRINITY_DN5788_c0_g1_i3.p1 TRINITY_DN5788_c0_g1~~TRINITY_DN5788_c0_g1_i3.p1  ORF type:complete len:497 (-),score=115.81 TRINITY_DN5788_c0_g1_i3:147-1637(-)
MDMLQRETRILETLDHPNIVKMVDVFETTTKIFYVLEYVPGGELFHAMKKQDGFSEAKSIFILKQILNALQYLHAQGFVHCDLKPENILLSDKDSDTPVVKISDFGLAQIVSPGQKLYAGGGTAAYVSPEVLLREGFGPAADMWAVGVITYILLCGFPPFFSMTSDKDEVLRAIKECKYKFLSPWWDNISPAARAFVAHCLQRVPEHRPTAASALRDPWILGEKSAPTVRSAAAPAPASVPISSSPVTYKAAGQKPNLGPGSSESEPYTLRKGSPTPVSAAPAPVSAPAPAPTPVSVPTLPFISSGLAAQKRAIEERRIREQQTSEASETVPHYEFPSMSPRGRSAMAPSSPPGATPTDHLEALVAKQQEQLAVQQAQLSAQEEELRTAADIYLQQQSILHKQQQELLELRQQQQLREMHEAAAQSSRDAAAVAEQQLVAQHWRQTDELAAQQHEERRAHEQSVRAQLNELRLRQFPSSYSYSYTLAGPTPPMYWR